MRIEPSRPPGVQPAETGKPVDQPVESAPESATGLRPDQVDLSRLSQVLTGEAGQEGRLEQLRLQVEDGSYQVPAAELSQRIVDFHLRSED